MHDGDNAIGISVKNPGGESWMLYGDKRALDYVDEDNKKRSVTAVHQYRQERHLIWIALRRNWSSISYLLSSDKALPHTIRFINSTGRLKPTFGEPETTQPANTIT